MKRKMVLLTMAFALVASACGTGHETAEVAAMGEAETLAMAAPAVTQPSPAPDGGDNEGIKVHGHWTIEVRNPDGTLDERHEFENALTANGAELLAVSLSDPTLSAEAYGLVAQRAVDPLGNDTCQAGTIPVTQSRAGSTVIWSGGFVVSSDGQVDAVTSCVGLVGGGGPTPFDGNFTEKILDTPIPVVAGQEVEITVEIFFS